MKFDPIQTEGMIGICAAKTKYVKLKVEQDIGAMTHDGHYQPLDPASPVLASVPQGQDGLTAHPNNSGEGKRRPAPKSQKGGAAAMKDEFSSGTVPKRIVEIDTAKYQKYLDDPSLNDEQRQQIIEALWSIITAFVDLGFGVHPMQEVIDDEACGQLTAELDQSGDTDSNDPKPTTKTLQDAFNAASDDT